jgi:nucleoid DNA-binding protein
MNTTEFKNALHQRMVDQGASFTKEAMAVVVDEMINVMQEGLNTPDEEGECKIVLRGFGTLKQVERKGRTYSVRGKQVTVGTRKTVTFKPGTDLARALLDTGLPVD